MIVCVFFNWPFFDSPFIFYYLLYSSIFFLIYYDYFSIPNIHVIIRCSLSLSFLLSFFLSFSLSLFLTFLLSFFLSINISIYLSIHLSIPLSFLLLILHLDNFFQRISNSEKNSLWITRLSKCLKPIYA